MTKESKLDLFKDIIPSVDLGIKELWDSVDDDGRKEIKKSFWVLMRFISSVVTNNRQIQEHFVLTVNEYYNKHWASIQQHPKLVWLSLCLTCHDTRKQFRHEFISLKKHTDKKTELLAELFPNSKLVDLEVMAKINTVEDIKTYCESLGWDKKQINGLKL